MIRQPAFPEYKIMLIGDVQVGKTSYFTRFVRNVISKKEPPTVGVDYSSRNITLNNGDVISAKIWDTAGSERYKSITTAHYRKSLGAMVFFDLTDSLTFEHTQNWLEEIYDHMDDEIVIMLIGNKSDLVDDEPINRAVTYQEASKFAKEKGLYYFETSAKTGHNVKESFQFMVEEIHKKEGLKEKVNDDSIGSFIIPDDDNTKKTICCNI